MGKWSWVKWANPISASYAALDKATTGGKLSNLVESGAGKTLTSLPLVGGVFKAAGGAGRKPIDYTTPAMSPEEQKLYDMLTQNITQANAMATQRNAYLQKILGTDWGNMALTPEQQASLDKAATAYSDQQTTAVNTAADNFEKNLRAKWAAQGIADSSIAGDSYNKLNTDTSKLLTNIAQNTAQFKYNTIQDVRNAARQDALAKIGLLNTAANPTELSSLFGTLEGSRNAEANRALQIALANAQKNPDFLTTLLLGGGGAALGGYFGGTEGAKVGAGVGLAGASAV